MKNLVLFTFFSFLMISVALSQNARISNPPLTYPLVSIYELCYVSPDSLHFCDSVVAKNGPVSAVGGPWTKQTSSRYALHNPGQLRDTVEIVGQIIVPAKVITFTGYNGYNFILRDTATNNPTGEWSSIIVRTASSDDTLGLYNAGILAYNVGDIIRIRGYADEFPSNNFVSYTQFVPIASTAGFYPTAEMPSCVVYVDTKPVPRPTTLTVDQFMKGGYDGAGKNIQYSTGEPWEGSYVQLTDLTVSAVVNSTNGTVALQDRNKNEIATMDGSKWFTNRSGTPSTSTIPYRDPASTFTTPKIGQVLDTIRGYIAGNSGSEALRGYRIFPVFPGDMVFGESKPNILTHRRTPVAMTSSDTAKISVKAYVEGSVAISSVMLYYSINNGPWKTDSMKGPNASDSTWTGKIRPVGADSLVKYFCVVTDANSNTATLANAAGGTAPSDTSQGFFFYTVRNRPLTISDIQYTPFSNGTSGLLGALVTVSGIITADTSDLDVNAAGTGPWYMQDGNSPWSGIGIYDGKGIMSDIHKGDSVSVTGYVSEYLQGTSGSIGRVTRLSDTAVTVLATGKSLPAPVLSNTASFAVGNGDPSAEPWEGMVVRFNNVIIVDTFPTFADNREYAVQDPSGRRVIVR